MLRVLYMLRALEASLDSILNSTPRSSGLEVSEKQNMWTKSFKSERIEKEPKAESDGF